MRKNTRNEPPAKKTSSPAFHSPKASEPQDLRQIFLDRAKAPIGPDFHASLPKKKAGEIDLIFRATRDPGIQFERHESHLLAALNILPENPFIALRLSFLYAGHGKRDKATIMLEKAQHLAGLAKVSPEALERS